MARLIIDNLTKHFSTSGRTAVQAVSNLSLAIEDKELLVLVGPSGSGKTTTLRLVAGLETPASGNITLDGVSLETLPPQERDVAMVFQGQALYPHLNAFENIALGLRLRKVPKDETRARVIEVAEMLGIASALERLPEQLSGGQRQRVAIGRALARRPRLFLLDEPLSNLDTPLRVQLRGDIARVQAELGITMLVVSHDQTDAMAMGHRIAVLKEGRLQQVAPPAQLYDHPSNRFVAGFMGFPPMNFLAGIVAEDGGRISVRSVAAGGHPWVLSVGLGHAEALRPRVGREVVLGLRPEHLSPGLGYDNGLQGTVQRLEALGAEKILHLKAADGPLQVRLLSSQRCLFTQGEVVAMQAEMERACYFDPDTGAALGVT